MAYTFYISMGLVRAMAVVYITFSVTVTEITLPAGDGGGDNDDGGRAIAVGRALCRVASLSGRRSSIRPSVRHVG